jgi:hypothetical protein
LPHWFLSACIFACQHLLLSVGLRCMTYAGGSLWFGLCLSKSVLSCVGGLGLVMVRVDLAILVSVVWWCWRKYTPVFKYILHFLFISVVSTPLCYIKFRNYTLFQHNTLNIKRVVLDSV